MVITIDVTNAEYGLLQDSLDYARRAFDAYAGYLSYEHKAKRIEAVTALKAKLKAARSVSP
jgi:hypothetical protein